MTGTAALILAGGSGVRLGGGRPKQYRMVAGEPILRRAIRCFLTHPDIDAVRVVIRAADRGAYDDATAGLDLLEPVDGGKDRQESGLRGLESLAALAPRKVLIHDAARPFVPADVISRVIAALDDAPAAIPALPVVDTLKRSDRKGRRVADTVDRAGLWRAQTPQGFRYADILDAHRAAAGKSLTDDAAIAEQAGLEIALVEGHEDNVKVTTMQDFERAERALAGGAVRIGTGFDVHRLNDGDAVMLCGVPVAHTHGLEGHSDADVGLHAITDALLGAIAEGDIGMHFPPSDEKWRGATSDVFLRHAGQMVTDKGGRIVNIDVTLICEAPKIGPHRGAMAARIADILDIEPGRVSVKATTTEGLGFTGRREGIAAQASAAVILPDGS